MITTTTEAAAAATTRGPRGRRQFGASLAGGAPAFRAGPAPTAPYPSRLGAPRARPRSARAPRRSRPGLQRFGLQARAGPPCTFAPPRSDPGGSRTATDGHQDRPNMLQTIHEGSESPNDRSKTLQMASRRPKRPPRRSKGRPRTFPRSSKTQTSSHSLRETYMISLFAFCVFATSKTTQEPPKITPRGPKEPQGGPRQLE